MTKTEKYLFDKYEATKWPYYSLNETLYYVGEGCKEELNKLAKECKIKKSSGINGVLIQIIEK